MNDEPAAINPIDAYIDAQLEAITPLLRRAAETIRAELPDAVEKLAWGMPTFWNGVNLIHFAAQKNHLGVYPGAEAMERFAAQLTPYKTSKGAIQFPYKTLGDEQFALIAQIAAWRGQARA